MSDESVSKYYNNNVASGGKFYATNIAIATKARLGPISLHKFLPDIAHYDDIQGVRLNVREDITEDD